MQQMTVGRVMGLDIGDVRIGIAMTDPLQIVASPFEVLTRATLEEDIAAIADLARRYEVVRIVAGLPLRVDGTRGPQAEKTEAFVQTLREAVDLEIVMQDERFTSAQAGRMLIGADLSRAKRRKVIDKVAAQHILQAYMDRAKPHPGE